MSQANDGVQSSITSFFASILENVASWIWSFITGAFGVSKVDDSQWDSVLGLTNWWVVVMMTPLAIAMILQLLSGLISQQPRRLVRALVGGATAIPMVAGAVYLVRQLTKVGDDAATALLDTLDTDPYVLFMRLFGFEKAPKDSGRDWNVVSLAPGSSSGAGGAVVVTAMAVIVVWILAFILMCSMIFRSFALILLAAGAPVALMLMPWEKTQSWARRWGEIVVALLIAKPLAATVLAVAIKLFAESKSFAGLSAGVVGMALACGAPLMALRLVSFAGGELAAAAQTAGGGHVLSRSSGFAARQVSRQTGGRFTLAALASRSTMSRPIQSTKAQFPTRALPPRVPLPGQIAGAAPARTSGGNAAALMPDGGTQGQGSTFPRARSDVADSPQSSPNALSGSLATQTGECSERRPASPASAASTAAPSATAPPSPIRPQTTPKPPIDRDSHD
ncbi:type IV secretion system protein [Arthrobacter globiformis]|uniref:type IV secretion system protein n=1 Tax=Arthrobacter globiformis TaxID=1665 RepID=UPI00278CCE3B|nr:type IV secretion system protein [Arthrobacter globiformis]MDQ0618068.1 ABC-type multidrug transport system fused ATPase/permease subunit [Arthrobacter globiformis]